MPVDSHKRVVTSAGRLGRAKIPLVRWASWEYRAGIWSIDCYPVERNL